MGALVDDAPLRTASSNFPELVVEWLPAQGPFVADGEWCDISEYVVSGSTSRGRQYELDQFQAGTCSLTLQSATRLFDPEHSTGPFYPWLVPMRQLQVSAIWSGTRYPVFRGYITDWGQTTVQDKLYTTTIQARDAFSLLEQIELPSSALALLIQADKPAAWFSLADTDSARATDSTANGNYGTYLKVSAGKALVKGDSRTGAAFDHSEGSKVVIANQAIITGYPFTVSAMINVDGTDLFGWKNIWHHRANQDVFAELVIEGIFGDLGTLRASIYDGVATRVIRTQIVVTGATHHVAWVSGASASDPWILYVDGVAVTTTVLIAGNPNWVGTGYFGSVIGNNVIGNQGFGADINGDTTRSTPGTIQDFAIWNSALSASTIANHANAALNGWANEYTGTRVTRLLGALDWPSSRQSVETGASLMGVASWSDGVSAIQLLQSWADTEFGQFYVSGAGVLTWRSRHYPYLTSTAITSQATFGDAHSTATLKYSDCELVRDETLIRNPVQATRANGITAIAIDVAGVEKYGNRRWSAPTSSELLDAAMHDRAAFLLSRYKELGTRLASLTINPRMDAALWPKALGLGMGNRITVKRTPLGLNTEVSIEQIIESVSHSFTVGEWTTTFRGSPTDPNVNTLLILDDATYGALDTYRLGY